ncbi:MAG: hypothetical protein KQI35_05265 [Bacteroidetes bacterium]|nr:hypothetical protein [Bacteroidota bacterium]
MKAKFIYSALLFLSVSMFVQGSNPHAWSGERQNRVWKNWSMSLNAGVTSYFGDLSKYDLQVPGKFKHESQPAFALTLNKQFTGSLGLAGQILYGGLKNEPTNELDFKTNFIEYNFHLRFNVIEAINGYRSSPVGFTVYAGVGQFLFKAVEYAYVEGKMNETVHNTRVPEFVYFGGGELSYAISDRFSISADMAIRQAQNDKLDNVVKGDDFDYYTFTSIGITYRFIDLFGSNKVPNLTRNDFKYGYR